MTALQQVRFLGASIMNFTANLGWGTQESRLNVGLISDVRYGDFFSPPPVGSPVYFSYMDWNFNGLLEHYSESKSFTGNPVFSVSVVDPRVLLDGVQIILSDYFGQTNGIPNLLNVFGYLENSDGFGGSGKNESGIEWGKISTTITQLTLAEQSSDYGGPISYKGYRYNINLAGLPNLPSFYRVSASPTMSLMEFINEMCEAGACEYFVTLQGSTITINTINRYNIPLQGQITQFVESTVGSTSTGVGLDMVNEVSSKFLIGGAKTDVFFQNYSAGIDNSISSSKDNPLWYYWGKDLNNDLIMSDGATQKFNLDARQVLIPNVPDTYQTDIDEMKSALASQDAWETFLWFFCFNKYIFDSRGVQRDFIYKIDSSGQFVVTSTQYKHSGDINPHYKKAYNIGIGTRIDVNITSYLFGTDPKDIVARNQKLYSRLQKQNFIKEQEDDMTKLYNMIHSFADEHYGRKFMVIVPEVNVALNPETQELIYSHSTTDAGFLSEDVWQDAINANLIPPYINEVTTPDGRVSSYVRFDNIDKLDLSELEPKDLLFGVDLLKSGGNTSYQGTKSVFIRCQVDDDYVFLDKTNYTSPRVVITLTSRVYIKNPERYGEKVIIDFINKVGDDKQWTTAQKDMIKNKLCLGSAGDLFSTFSYPTVALPSMAAIPLKSNTETYGPWFAAGANGRIEVEHSEDLVPWNFDGYDNMNHSGQARVSESVGNLQWIESGSVEFPGVPAVDLGSQLLSVGPYVTDIAMSIGQDKVTTTYQMRSWNPKYGKIAKYNLDRTNRLNKISQQIRRNMREQLKINTFKGKYLEVKSASYTIQ